MHLRKDTTSTETQQEQQLRLLFQQTAPTHVDTAHAWRNIAQQVQDISMQKQPRFTFHMFNFHTNQENFMRKRVFALVATLLFAFSIMAAGVAFTGIGNVYKGNDQANARYAVLNDPSIYTKVNQTQQKAGHTVTIDRAYADASTIMVFYEIKKGQTFTSPHSILVDGKQVQVIGGACDEPVGNKERCTLFIKDNIAAPTGGKSTVQLQLVFGEWAYNSAKKMELKENANNVTFTFDVRYSYENPIKELPNNTQPWLVPAK